jgi:hypothetical protein
MENGNSTAKKAAEAAGKQAVEARARVITYLCYALDDVHALNPMAVHLLEMTIALLNEDPTGEAVPPPRKLS